MLPARALLGEGPLWDPEDRVLYWVDIKGRGVHRFDPATGRDTRWPTPEEGGSLARRAAGGVVAALCTGFHFLDLDTGAVTPVAQPERDRAANRFNDGKPDRRCRFWAGSMHDPETGSRELQSDRGQPRDHGCHHPSARKERRVTDTSRMRLGLMLPIGAGALGEGRPVRWTDLREMARTAEAVGVDTLFLPDHLLFRKSPPGNLVQVNMDEGKLRGFWESWTILAALAEATHRVHLGPLVACTGFRNPAVLAKMADTLDEVSDGRLVLGLGAGWHEPEYDAFGIPYDHRVGRFEEALAIIVPLLREGRVDFQGQYYQARDCVLAPRGPRPTGPPILIGAQRPRILALAARYADLYDADYHLEVAGVSAPFQALDRACAEAGRDPATITRTAGTRIALRAPGEPRPGLPGVAAPTGAAVFDLGGMRQMARAGTPTDILEHVRTFRAAGVQQLTLSLVHPPGPKGIEMLAPIVEGLRR